MTTNPTDAARIPERARATGIASYVSKQLETCTSALEAPTITRPETPTDAMPDVIEDLLEGSPECQVPECSSAAAWLLTMRCCRLTAVFCDSHHDAQVRGSFGEAHDGTCSGCSRTWMPIARAIEWRPL